MACFHPMILIKRVDMSDPAQRKFAMEYKMRHKGTKEARNNSTLIVPRELAISEGFNLEKSDAIPIPCGNCIGCRLEYSRIWAERAMREASQWKDNYFITLTYDDDHLPIGPKGVPTLENDAISDFMKELRIYMKREYDVDNIRFFACSEYGTNGERGINPHYHIILFNCPFQDLQERHPIPVDGKIKWIRQYDSNGQPLLYSPLAAKAWHHRGTCQIGQVTFESCAYVARYVVKKLKGDGAQQYIDTGTLPPYSRMSRRPGIGHDWYLEHLNEIYNTDNYFLKRGDKVILQKPHRYIDRLLQDINPQAFYDIKKLRVKDFYSSIHCLYFENQDFKNQLNIKCDIKESQIKLLKRNL